MRNPAPGIFNNVSTGAQYVSLNRASGLDGVNTSAMLKAIKESRLPVYIVSGCRCVDVADLEKFKQEGI